MGLFAESGKSRSSQGGDYPKPGQYIICIEMAKHGNHQTAGHEQAIFECHYVSVSDKALWTGDPKQVPSSDKGPLLNVPGSEPKPGQPCSFVFPQKLKGNAARLKAFVLKALDMTDEDWGREVAKIVQQSVTKGTPMGADQVSEILMSKLFESNQPLKNVMIEIKAGEQTTTEKKKIVASRPLRRVWAEEFRQPWTENKLDPATVEFFTKDKRFETMVTSEAAEQAKKKAQAAAVA